MDDWGKPEYRDSDLGRAVRGKYAKRIQESSNVVLLDPTVAEAFPNDKAVNKALRTLIKVRVGAKRKTKAREGKRAA
jgi:hypothetical protein